MSFHAFVTGFPGFIGKRLVRELAAKNPGGQITVLVQPQLFGQAQRALESISGARIEVLTGDIVDMHLGLDGREYQRLVEESTHIFHLAAVSSLRLPVDVARRVNVDGTRNVLELARECKRLERLVYFSTCYVSGDRVGVIAEDELENHQSFRNAYEETKYLAERLVERSKMQIPVTIIRPSTVVGDSATGAIDRFEGPYYLGMLLVLSPLVLPLPLPGNGVAPLNVVPVDFVVEATWNLTQNPAAAGKTVHLVDPNPMSARRVYELIAERSHKRLPRFTLSARVTDLFLRIPGVEKVARPQRTAINYVNHLALYNCTVALELLAPSNLKCPPLHTYLDKLIDYALETWRAQRDEVEDPLDQPLR